MQRFCQGQLDFFCAAYAVINVLTALYGTSLSQARAMLASVLSDISHHPALWQATLYNDTDFHWLSDYMLLACSKATSFPLSVHRPFANQAEIPESAHDLANAKHHRTPLKAVPDTNTVWSALEEWLPHTLTQPRAGSAQRAVLLRFHRHLHYTPNPYVSHWSMTDCHYMDSFQLRDASKEENALYSLNRDACVFSLEEITQEKTVRIEPESIYFIKRG